MKCGLLIFLSLFVGAAGWSQPSLSQIDWQVQHIDAPTPDSLGRMLSRLYSTDLQKARAVYSWIAWHINYNTAVYKPRQTLFTYSPDPLDTATTWPSADEMTARKVMRRRLAVCDGYSRLFKVLCQYAGLDAAVVQGFARGYSLTDRKFKTNHTWNVVRIDSVWQLVDVTWGSGHLSGRDEYVQQPNYFYFLTPPQPFGADHFPEDLKWSLSEKPDLLAEFRRAAFRTKNFSKYGIDGFAPERGMIEASVGDTIHFSIHLSDVEKAKHIGADPFIDSSSYNHPYACFLEPVFKDGNKMWYAYIVSPGVEWVNLLFNGDVILRYYIQPSIKKEEVTIIK